MIFLNAIYELWRGRLVEEALVVDLVLLLVLLGLRRDDRRD
jgi:hypothetical protein